MLIDILKNNAEQNRLIKIGAKYGMTISNFHAVIDHFYHSNGTPYKQTEKNGITANLKFTHGTDFFGNKTLNIYKYPFNGKIYYDSSFGTDEHDPSYNGEFDLEMNEHPSVKLSLNDSVRGICKELKDMKIHHIKNNHALDKAREQAL